ncbi:hypothetical protein EHI8A_050980 [Entamoeba histolytica HM-1:IMSS-B]|uniref:Uncharacterized protein n=6 Tax=Entamoeba histolytica TaxID=5759 RepID=C4M9G0_ENTH1|nr:hypothetical protein EHI_067540 [Entamoeba histolytica HM-1:IMSS]EMD48286.1 Hypothetical protein EHI5A_078950 [Entamoeba histolytica KU27]EMH76317.1 hypothetical protein EHI8A_050980 [Entamoeba histolytica HM-1:IMSS-B]EMS14345.1 hypothetical protein KM1_102520 [Entamoeba histolytica HM-3:IMSS]ENY64186.1 hypothetical protein EHI7A_051240 [Entamoeba histolytica HM-1:IMSS-A]GAT98304.1 hypothetical protein CL6EHI_067540 [Entamoeba histolytica]|eukprot:XP_657155.1 hypothetical protein EHI_067540 [Entamoeba histolytica HM-1:IMSS]
MGCQQSQPKSVHCTEPSLQTVQEQTNKILNTLDEIKNHLIILEQQQNDIYNKIDQHMKEFECFKNDEVFKKNSKHHKEKNNDEKKPKKNKQIKSPKITDISREEYLKEVFGVNNEVNNCVPIESAQLNISREIYLPDEMEANEIDQYIEKIQKKMLCKRNCSNKQKKENSMQ